MRTHQLITGAALLLAGLTLMAVEYEFEPPVPGSYKLPIVKAAADGEVLDHHGKPFHLGELTKGRVTVLSHRTDRARVEEAVAAIRRHAQAL